MQTRYEIGQIFGFSVDGTQATAPSIFICEPPTCRFLDSYSNFTAMKIKIKWNVKQIEINDFDPSEGLQNTKAKILALTGTKFAFRAVKVHHFSFQCRGTA